MKAQSSSHGLKKVSEFNNFKFDSTFKFSEFVSNPAYKSYCEVLSPDRFVEVLQQPTTIAK